jgi:hypothetical protein
MVPKAVPLLMRASGVVVAVASAMVLGACSNQAHIERVSALAAVQLSDEFIPTACESVPGAGAAVTCYTVDRGDSKRVLRLLSRALAEAGASARAPACGQAVGNLPDGGCMQSFVAKDGRIAIGVLPQSDGKYSAIISQEVPNSP